MQHLDSPLWGLDSDQDLTSYASDIASAGFSACGRYLKNLAPSEVRALHQAGLALWLIHETSANSVLGGQQAGREAGARALAQARTLGVPNQCAIWVTADRGVTSGQLRAVEDYWEAFEEQIRAHYRVGAYANGYVLGALSERGLSLCWLPQARGWAGYTSFLQSGLAALLQGLTITNEDFSWNPLAKQASDVVVWPSLGFAYDADLILVDDFGQWNPPASAPGAA